MPGSWPGRGELSQGLCAPWQNDYRECACYYWAASRPDYVSVEPGPNGTSVGIHWLQKDRGPRGPTQYVPDNLTDSRLVSYEDLFRDWEKYLHFQVGGRDSEAVEGSAAKDAELTDAPDR